MWDSNLKLPVAAGNGFLSHISRNSATAAMADNVPTTIEKALAINLDPLKYGTIVEIGAGQEVARWFFQAGGAAGTIAKTMSAYDMNFSDDIYGVAPFFADWLSLRAGE